MPARKPLSLAVSLYALALCLSGWNSTTGMDVRAGSPKHYVVVMVLDGARPDYLQSRNLVWVNWLRHHGTEYTNAFAGQVSANTPPSHATIGTGTFPRRNGVQGFVWRDPASGHAIRPGDQPQIDVGQLDHVLQIHRVLTADHGMSPVHARLPFSVFDDAIARAGTAKVYVEADTAAAIGISDLSKAREVARNVAELGKQYMDAVFYKQSVHGTWRYRAAFFRPSLTRALRSTYAAIVATTACAEGPDVFAVMAPRVTTGDRIDRGYHWLEGHLGPGWDEQHIPLIVSGSEIRAGRVSHKPARLVDIEPTLERVLGIRHVGPPVDGTVMADALQHPTHQEVTQQQQAAAPWSSRIAALQHRSSY